MAILEVRHLTRYRYRRPVTFGEHRFMLRPREGYDQRVLESRLVITPEPVSLRYVHDVFGNCVGFARFDTPARELIFESRVRLEHLPHAPAVDDGEDDPFPIAYDPDELPDLARSIAPQHPDPEGVLHRWALSFVPASGGALAALSAMTRAIRAEFTYNQRLTGGAHAPLDTLRTRQGSCRDFAVLMIEAARTLGFAARFVSGYIYSPGWSGGKDGVERLGGGHTHAWTRIYLPRAGWVEFDPTNGIVGASDLIRVAVVRDPAQASPLCGTYDGTARDYLGMDVTVSVGQSREPDQLRRVA